MISVVIVFNLLVGCTTLLGADINKNKCEGAIPKSNETRWYTAEDLPTDIIYRDYKNFSGQGYFKLNINNTGRVFRCEVKSTTGSDIFDKSICANINRRASFNNVPILCNTNNRKAFYIINLKWNVDDKGGPIVSLHKSE